MLGRLFQILLCFMIAMQPPSRSLFAELYYYRLEETGQPVLIKLLDNVAAELADVARNVDTVDEGKIAPNLSETFVQFESPTQVNSLELNEDNLQVKNESSNETSEPEVAESDRSLSETESLPIDAPKEVDFGDRIASGESKLPDESTTEVTTDAKSPQSDEVSKEKQEDIPSFSEWAQKQLEEAEKNKETVLNDSLHSVHKTVTSSNNLKIRSKNYASPDCGAKIVAVNPEAGSAGYVLSSSRDEYMLNTCTSRIWFIVELCEAIQAKKIELANFELFSSTPKNFSVFVSDRFPTRDWAGVGQFIAKDERDIQTFNLHPHLFGKFIKVELHSHYGSEHYCPISLFRAYGTSELEVFETENLLTSGDDDDDDDDDLNSVIDEKKGDLSKNLFGSARDAVMSIMKKAAEVLVKSSDSKNSTMQTDSANRLAQNCLTPSHIIVCDNCSNSLYTEVYDLMSCHSDYLKTFVQSPLVHQILCNSDVCQPYGLNFKNKKTSTYKTDVANYVSAFLIPSYVAALCNMLAIIEKKVVLNTSYETDLNITSNLTIDKKTQTMANMNLIDNLLQEPFSDCKEKKEFCENKIPLDDKKETVDSPAEQPKPVEESPPVLDINPTKTLDADYENTNTNVKTTPTSTISPNTATHNIKTSTIEADQHFSNENYESKVEIQIDQTKSTMQNDSKDVTSPELNLNLGNENETQPAENTSTIASNDLKDSNVLGNSGEDVNSSQEQLVLDNLLSELEQGNDLTTPAPTPNSISPPIQGQKESVFLRLSNRIKTLEKNMSLSSQYLEELSRRYKKQVEEMQKTFEKTLLTISEESKRAEERELRSSEEMLILQQQIAQLSASVGILLIERDSFFGNVSFVKIVILQVIITLVIFYFFSRRKVTPPQSRDSESLNDVKLRRSSAEDVVSFSEPDEFSPKRRLSEEILSQISSSSISKSEKKKRRRKSSIIHRSVSMTTSPMLEKSVNKTWPDSSLSTPVNDSPIALEEAEFIIPEVEPNILSEIGNENIPYLGEVNPKKDFPKTNGTLLGIKMVMNNKKPAKMRRLSSPAFFNKPQLVKPIHTNENELVSDPNVSALSEKQYFYNNGDNFNKSEVNINKDNLSNQSSAGELSQSSNSVTSSYNQKKRSKKNSFKNILKKVF